jgi:hypothetical protein
MVQFFIDMDFRHRVKPNGINLAQNPPTDGEGFSAISPEVFGTASRRVSDEQ